MAKRRTAPDEEPRADAARNRERILDAAAVVLARDPEASLTEVAEEAGLSRATAYRHFADTSAVRAALVEEAMAVGRDLLSQQLGTLLAPEGPPEPLIDMMLGLLQTALPLQYRWTRAIANEPIPDGGLIDVFTPLSAAILRRGQASGELRGDFDPEATGRALIALALYGVRRIHSEQAPVSEAIAMLRPFLDGLRRSPRPAK